MKKVEINALGYQVLLEDDDKDAVMADMVTLALTALEKIRVKERMEGGTGFQTIERRTEYESLDRNHQGG